MEALIGAIYYFSFNYPTKGWLACEGQIYRREQCPELFNLLGSKFGGDGITTFGIPNLNGAALYAEGWTTMRYFMRVPDIY